MSEMIEAKIALGAPKLFGLEGLFPHVSPRIAKGDGMLQAGQAGLEHYFTVGASALAAILDAMKTARVDPGSVARILDYACGYGRVLRWLKARFPQAEILGVDADPKAAAAAAEVAGVQTAKLDIELRAPLSLRFDLIWVGSLFTHLPRDESLRVLSYLRHHLNEKGLLVFTTHGALVHRRLLTRERTYNLDEEGVRLVLREADASGYGFSGYPRMPAYGISVTRPSTVAGMIESCGMELILYKSAGWASHQDVFACTPRSA